MTLLLYTALALAGDPILTSTDPGRDHMVFSVGDQLVEVSTAYQRSRKEYVWYCRTVAADGTVSDLSIPFYNVQMPTFTLSNDDALWVGPAVQAGSKNIGLVRCGVDGKHDVKHWSPAGKRSVVSAFASRDGFWLNTAQGAKLRPVHATLDGESPDLGSGSAYPVMDGGRLDQQHAVMIPSFGASVLSRMEGGKMLTVASLDGKTAAAFPLGEDQWLTAKHTGGQYTLQVGVTENGTFKPSRELEVESHTKGWTEAVAVHPVGDHWLAVLVDQHSETGSNSEVQASVAPPPVGGESAAPVAGVWRAVHAVRLVLIDAQLNTVWSQVHEAKVTVPVIQGAPVRVTAEEASVRVHWVGDDGVYWTEVAGVDEPKVEQVGFELAVEEIFHGTRLTKAGSSTPGQLAWFGDNGLAVSTGTKGDWEVHVVYLDGKAPEAPAE